MAFGGLAGEITPPMKKRGKTLAAEFAFARSPYLVGFRAGWFKFTICTGHLYYGKAKADDDQRKAESKQLVELMKKRMDDDDRWANNAILLGDFNIFSTKEFKLPEALRGTYTNAKLDKPFDQMAFLAPEIEKQVQPAKAGVFPFYNYVYRDSDQDIYLKGKEKKEYAEWRTYKMSDHLPVWVELGVDFSRDYLNNKMKKADEG
jgi:endonuclease/exonuclease/phosphatase family metal-dependent hydrolase